MFITIYGQPQFYRCERERFNPSEPYAVHYVVQVMLHDVELWLATRYFSCLFSISKERCY